MTTITIPKKLIKEGDLVIVPRREYEELVVWREVIKSFKSFIPTLAQKRDLKKAREEYKKGKYITINELKCKLGIKN